MTVALKIKATKIGGSHPLKEVELVPAPEKIVPRGGISGGALLIDVAVAAGNSKVAMPTFVQQIFGSINSGNIATIGGSGDLLFSSTGDAYINYVIDVQLDNTTGPYTGAFNLYFMWVWAGQNKYLNSVQIDNIGNEAWQITISGLVSMWANDLKVYMGVDNAQDTFYWWNGDFQLFVPTANFPAFVPLVPPPLIGQGGGSPPTFPPPTPPPIGAIPAGILVGPAIQPSSVPPSTAGIPRLVFTYGSATTPPATAAFPEFTTTFPSPPIVFSNIFTDGVSPTTPPSTASTPPLGLSYNTGGVWGPPIGPALPVVVPPVRPFMAEAEAPPPQFMTATNGNFDEAVYEEPSQDQPATENNGTVYDETSEKEEDWFEDTSSRTSKPEPSKPKRGRKK